MFGFKDCLTYEGSPITIRLDDLPDSSLGILHRDCISPGDIIIWECERTDDKPPFMAMKVRARYRNHVLTENHLQIPYNEIVGLQYAEVPNA